MILRIELRRGAAAVTALLSALVTAVWLHNWQSLWAGEWSALAVHFRFTLWGLAPVFAGAAMWQAGRDRRARVDELLATVPRSAWQPLVVSWAAVTLGGLAGLAVPLSVAAVLVGRRATYAGSGWWWTILVGMVALGTASAFGVLLGRFLAIRALAPVVAVVLWLALAPLILYYEGPWWEALSPLLGGSSPVDVWSFGFHAWQAGWLIALTAVLLLLAARHWRAAAVPAVLAVVLALVPAGVGPTFDDPGVDTDAQALVCTQRSLEVCVIKPRAFLLEDLATAMEPGLARLATVPGAPVRAVDRLAGVTGPDVMLIDPDGQAAVLRGLSGENGVWDGFGRLFMEDHCPNRFGESAVMVSGEAASWVITGEPAGRSDAEQRKWVGEVLAGVRACDEFKVYELGNPA